MESLGQRDVVQAQLAKDEQDLQNEIAQLQEELRLQQDPRRMQLIQEMISDLLYFGPTLWPLDRGHCRAETLAAGTIPVGTKLHQPYVHCPNNVTHEKLGTLAYAALEVRFGFLYLYSADFGRSAFFSMSCSQFPFGALGEHFSLRFEPGEIDESAQALLEEVLSVNPLNRPNIHELKSHPFFASVDWDAIATRTRPASFAPRIPTPSPSPKNLRISLGTPYTSLTDDPLPDFTFISSRFRQSCSDLAGAAPTMSRRTIAEQLFERIRMWCISYLGCAAHGDATSMI